ncbi:hypothetical protein HY491_01245 [Candidatus Woesearchaeota archaeon]|nr:hypothetical protein [Candidatus Woesearchaeota archaeon]
MQQKWMMPACALLALFIISGCQALGRQREASLVDTRFHQGTIGMQMQFVPGNPPTIVYDDPAFDLRQPEMQVLLEVRNRGAFDVGKSTENQPFGLGYVALSGYDQSIIRYLQPATPNGIVSLAVEGKSRFNAEGGLQVLEFPPQDQIASIVELPEGVNTYRPRLQATACYQYETIAAPVVCVDPDPYREVIDKPCRVGGIAGSGRELVAAVEGIAGGQGAPVTISNIQEEAQRNRVQFEISVSNTGGGKVVDWDSINSLSCPFGLNYQQLDNIQYEVRMVNPLTGLEESLVCEPLQLKMYNNRAVLFCRTGSNFDFSGQTAYQTPLYVRLQYGYMDAVSKNIEVRRAS